MTPPDLRRRQSLHQCTPLFSVPVALGKKVTVKGKSSTVLGVHDKHKLKLAGTAG